jgi:ribose transport system permease protein
LMSGGIFVSRASLNGLALDAAVGILLAAGMTFLLAAGLLDLSLGANLVMSSVMAALVLKALAPDEPAADTAGLVLASIASLLAAIATGAAYGLINAIIVTRLRVNSLIATLGTGGAGAGLVLVVTGGSNISGFPPQLQLTIGTASIAGILPYQTLVVVLVAALLWFLMERTQLGTHAKAIGNSREAAFRTGIDIPGTVVWLFVMLGALAGLAGFLTITRFSTTTIGGSEDAALAAIAAAVIGGTSLFGGIATIGGSVIGALLPVVLASGLIVIGIPSFYQRIAVGVVLILAVYIDQERRSGRETS